jgi:predicted O-methyltransferase YrrM
MVRPDSEIINRISRHWYEKGHMNADQRDYFIETLQTLKPRFCLEIGFASGRSAVTTLVAANPELLISVDLSLDYIQGARAHAEALQRDFHNLKIFEGPSTQVLNENFFQSYFPKGIDFAFIDGDHTYTGCLSDLRTILPHLSQDGIMIVDDYRSGAPNGVPFPEVTNAVDDFVLQKKLSLRYWQKGGKGIACISPAGSVVARAGIRLRKLLYRVRRAAARTGIGRVLRMFKSKRKILGFCIQITKSDTQKRYLLEWIRSIREGYFLDKPSPWLTFDSIGFIRERMQEGMKVFEYGSGGSTLFWLSLGATCVTVEHDADWFAALKKHLNSSDRVDYRFVPPERNEKREGTDDPEDPECYISNATRYKDCQFYHYVSQIDEFPDGFFDLILIDGRARPSCIKHSVKKIRINGALIIDNTERPYYLTKAKAYLHNFERREFHGVGPILDHMWKTDVYIRKV